MEKLVLYGFALSTFTRTARMVCIEKGIDYRLENPALGDESYLKLHPFRKMPALRHDGQTLFETLAIASYVDSLREEPALEPARPFERAIMLQWISALNDVAYADVVGGLVHEQTPEALEAARARLSVVDRRLSSVDFLAGDRLTLADLFLAPMVAFAARTSGRESLLRGMENLDSWFARIAERKSFRETEPG